MADNKTAEEPDGTDFIVATDEIAGVNYQRIKLALGADGVAVDASAGAGINGTGVQRVTIATDDAVTVALAAIQAAAEDNTTPASVKFDQTTPGTTNGVQINAALPAGTNNIGDVDVLTLPALAAGTNTIGAVVNVSRATASGATSSRVVAAASTNATSLKASAGNIVNIDVFNVAAYDVFLKLYNKASAPTVGTDTPVWTIPVKAGTGFSREFIQGKSFATGIAYAITKLQADSDTTVVVASDLTGAIDWI